MQSTRKVQNKQMILVEGRKPVQQCKRDRCSATRLPVMDLKHQWVMVRLHAQDLAAFSSASPTSWWLQWFDARLRTLVI